MTDIFHATKSRPCEIERRGGGPLLPLPAMAATLVAEPEPMSRPRPVPAAVNCEEVRPRAFESTKELAKSGVV